MELTNQFLQIRGISRGVLIQFSTAFIASLSSFNTSSAFTWIAPILIILKSQSSEVPLTPDQSSWVVSFMFLGSFVSCFPSAILVDILGRKLFLLLTGPIYALSWSMILSTRSIEFLYAVRFIQGFGMGMVYIGLPLYLAEISEPRIRGGVGYMFLMLWYLGTSYEFSIGPFVSYEFLAWISLAPPLVFLGTFAWFPETPYYLLMKGKEAEAEKSFAWLRGFGDSIPPELKDEWDKIKASVEEENENKVSWISLFSTEVGRKGLALVTLVNAAYMLAGGTSITTYSIDTFTKIGGEDLPPWALSLLMTALLLLIVPLAGLAVDRLGRRPVLLISSIGAFFTLGISSLAIFLLKRTSFQLLEYTWVPKVFIMVSYVFIGAGTESVAILLQAELFSNNARGAASWISFLIASLISFFVLKMYQVIDDGVGLDCLYGIFSLMSILSSILIAAYIPETKGKNFAEIQTALIKKKNEHH